MYVKFFQQGRQLPQKDVQEHFTHKDKLTLPPSRIVLSAGKNPNPIAFVVSFSLYFFPVCWETTESD